MPHVLFETPRLVIRRLRRDDTDTLLAILGDPASTRFYGSGQPWTRAAVERLLTDYPHGDARLLSEPGIVTQRADRALVGYGGVGYFRRGETTADLFFIFQPEQWGKGFATELAAAAIATAFRQPDIAAIHATVMPHNYLSIRVLEKVGLRFLGYLPDRDRLHYRIEREATGP